MIGNGRHWQLGENESTNVRMSRNETNKFRQTVRFVSFRLTGAEWAEWAESLLDFRARLETRQRL